MATVYVVQSIGDCCECDCKELNRIFATRETAESYMNLWDQPEKIFVLEEKEIETGFTEERFPVYAVQWFPFRTGREDHSQRFLIVGKDPSPFNWQSLQYEVMKPEDRPEDGIVYKYVAAMKDDGFYKRWQSNVNVRSIIGFDHAWKVAKSLMEKETGENLLLPVLKEVANV